VSAVGPQRSWKNFLVWRSRSSRGWKAPRYLPGRHNSANACAAVACARVLGVPPSAIARALATFRGVEHRLELVRTWRGVNFMNDSKATNVDSTRVALEAFPKPLMLIMGGQDKGAPYGPLVPLLRKKAKRVLLIGEAVRKIERDLLGRVPVVRVARRWSAPWISPRGWPPPGTWFFFSRVRFF
jgi:UDP-N-acetylmuramoylalanine-D-glutamate ligase